jgi:two-component system, CitB family, sensor kinase
MRRNLALSTRILLMQFGIVAFTVLLGAVVSVRLTREQLDRQYEQRVLAIAGAVAASPSIRDAFDNPSPAATIQPLAEAVRQASGATFVVVANRDHIRYSHPNPAEIGRRLSTDPGVAMQGRAWVGTETGTLGRSVRAKVPVRGAGGAVIGIVSVGILERQVNAALLDQLPELAVYVLIALALGVAGSVLLARSLKRQTFGLEPRDIAALLEQREAMLHGIKEGVVATDPDGRTTLVNDEARRLLGLGAGCEGRRLGDLLSPGRLRDVLTGDQEGGDQVVLAGERILLANRMPVVVRDQVIGAVVTLRDRTELDGLTRELDGARSLADALRAQAHEFSNRLHTIAGLVELGRTQDAVRFIADATLVHQELAESLVERVGDQTLTALLLAKAAVASERGVTLRLAADTLLIGEIAHCRDVVTVVGNLVDNALDAVTSTPAGGWVEVGVRAGETGGVVVRVRDSGPGIDPALVDAVFRDGFTTKVAESGVRRGLGLALVAQAARRWGGSAEVRCDGGAVFTVTLPDLAVREATAGAVVP